jgi:hypothetical protein
LRPAETLTVVNLAARLDDKVRAPCAAPRTPCGSHWSDSSFRNLGALTYCISNPVALPYIGSSMPPNPLPAPPVVATAAQNAIAPTPIPPDATEEQLIALWLHGKSLNTIRAYRRDVAAFRAFIGKPIRLAYLGDLQRHADALTGSPASCARRLLVVKSLLSFASWMGFRPSTSGPPSGRGPTTARRTDPRRTPGLRAARRRGGTSPRPRLDPLFLMVGCG